ncbi:MAG TPA: aminotransferase class V-fold PLP-dependent enzyme, partial [Steroidobacteraceae bacterium]|nr:aminotransferase class V-fold PLP-dependent enzyme [Steroidobacteraceae bacterium]
MSLVMADVRGSFPHLDTCLYLNTASVGLSWPGQGAAVSRFYDDDKAIGYDGRDRWHAMHMKCRNLVAKLLNVAPETVSFASSTSEALNLVAGAVKLAPGDQIVLAEDEFPSVVLAWQRAVEMGAQLVRVPIPVESERTD